MVYNEIVNVYINTDTHYSSENWLVTMFALENLKEDKRMKKWMYDCVLETPATAEAMFKNKDALVGKLVDLFLAKDYKKIVMVASGSSYNIANCSKYAIQNYLGVKVDLINSVTYAKYDYKFHENALASPL